MTALRADLLRNGVGAARKLHHMALMERQPFPLSHALLALAAVVVWGSNFVVIKVGLAHVPPLTFEMVGPGQGYNDVLFTRDAGRVRHVDELR